MNLGKALTELDVQPTDVVAADVAEALEAGEADRQPATSSAATTLTGKGAAASHDEAVVATSR